MKVGGLLCLTRTIKLENNVSSYLISAKRTIISPFHPLDETLAMEKMAAREMRHLGI